MSNFRAAASRVALTAALTAGLAVSASPALAAKKDKEAPAAAAAKANYSKPFVVAYQPVAKLANTDAAAAKAQIPAIVAAATTPDDKMALGQLIVNVGVKTSDVALQRQGLDLMFESGKIPVADIGRDAFAGAQLAYQAKDWANAIKFAQRAIDAGYAGDSELLMAESYFAQNQAAQGLTTLDKAFAKKIAAGQPIPEPWIKRAVAQAYQAKLDAQSVKYAGMYAQYYPSTASWGDAIAIQRNLNNYEPADLLDLMRLSARTKSLRNSRDYVDYLQAADPRRLPGETQRVVDQGIAAGILKPSDVFVNEVKTISSARIKADQADLPALERDARGASATAAVLTAAGDAFLSYNQSAKAEEFYKLALAKPGADVPRVLTRLGIAQLDQGKSAEAQANFAKVQGARQAIAQLWSIYAKQAAAPAATPAT
jgi:hypothetical protein